MRRLTSYDNPFAPRWLTGQMVVTLLLLAILAAVFLKGLREAIGIAVILVAVYLMLNAVVTIRDNHRDPSPSRTS